jgi:TfoX/Sxy family transcriptional regulator of competence genes
MEMEREMKTDSSFVTFIMEQLQDAGNVACRSMFGGYAVYCDSKVVALICDDRLFVKPTAIGKTMCETVTEAPPYPGAKPYLLIEDNLEDREWLCGLIRETAGELPVPVKKKARGNGKVK